MKTMERDQAFHQALHQPIGKRAIFIVPSHEIHLYQEALLHYSTTKSYLGIRVYTLEMYLKDLFQKSRLTYERVSKEENFLKIIQCIDSKELHLFKNRDHFSTIIKIYEACQFLHDYQICLDDYDMSNLTLFSQHKFEDLKYIYSSLSFDQPNDLLKQIPSFQDTLYVCSDLTPFQSCCLDELEGHVEGIYQVEIEYQESDVVQQLDSLFVEQQRKPLDHHPFYLYKASDKEDEIKMILSSIYDLHQQGVPYDDIAIYLHGSHYEELLVYLSQKAYIPIDFKKTNDHDAVKSFFDCFMEYAIEDDDLALLACLKVMEKNDLYDVCRCYQETKNKVYLEKVSHYHDLEAIKDTFNFAHTFKDKADALAKLLPYIEEEKSGAIQHFLDECRRLEGLCFNDLFKQWYAYFYDEKESVPSLKHHVRLFKQEEALATLVGVSYVYYLGVNETVVPKSFKDQDLLLDHEKSFLKQKEERLPLMMDLVKKNQSDILNVLKQEVKQCVLSCCSIEEDGSVYLPSSLYLRMNQLFTYQEMTYTMHPLFKEDAILNHKYMPSLVKEYTKTKFKSGSIKDEIDLYPIHEFKVSASQIECYNQCPFKYYLRYGLKLESKKSELLQANEIGTMMHHCFEVLHDLIFTPWYDVIKDTTQLDAYLFEKIDCCLENYIKENELETKINFNKRNKEIYKRLKKDCLLLLKILHAQQSLSTFELLDQEGSVYGKSPKGYTLYGCYDRLDVYHDYLKIVDYKSSKKEIDLNLAMQGFNIQMLLYMDLACKKYHKNKGIVAYFNGKPRVFKVDHEFSFIDVLKEYQLSGYMVKDNDLILALDKEVYERTSPVYKLKYVKNKDDFTGNILDQTCFDHLMEHIYQHIDELLTSLLEGNIDIAPKGSKDIATQIKVNPCTYCEYHAICQKDVFYHEEKEVMKRSSQEIETILKGGHEDECL